SERWRIRRDHLFLVPGDSPLGARLPLSSLEAQGDDGAGADVSEPVRTALTVELRDGTLAVFMPPVDVLEDYLALLAAVEDTAGALKVAVHIEGYPPPDDHRLSNIKV